MRLLPWLLIAVNVLKERECDTEKCFVHLLYDEFLTRTPDFDHVPSWFLKLCRPFWISPFAIECAVVWIVFKSNTEVIRMNAVKNVLYTTLFYPQLLLRQIQHWWAYKNYIIFNETHCVIQMITICISKALYARTSQCLWLQWKETWGLYPVPTCPHFQSTCHSSRL